MGLGREGDEAGRHMNGFLWWGTDIFVQSWLFVEFLDHRLVAKAKETVQSPTDSERPCG